MAAGNRDINATATKTARPATKSFTIAFRIQKLENVPTNLAITQNNTYLFTDRLMAGPGPLIPEMLVRIQNREPPIQGSSKGRTADSESAH